MFKMIKTLNTAFNKKMFIQPHEYRLSDVTDAWSKIDRILADAYMDAHVDTAERMLKRMLRQFGFTQEQRESPLIAGMFQKIWDTRETVTQGNG